MRSKSGDVVATGINDQALSWTKFEGCQGCQVRHSAAVADSAYRLGWRHEYARWHLMRTRTCIYCWNACMFAASFVRLALAVCCTGINSSAPLSYFIPTAIILFNIYLVIFEMARLFVYKGAIGLKEGQEVMSGHFIKVGLDKVCVMNALLEKNQQCCRQINGLTSALIPRSGTKWHQISWHTIHILGCAECCRKLGAKIIRDSPPHSQVNL